MGKNKMRFNGQEVAIDNIVFEGEQDFIREESVNKITSFFDEVDDFRAQILSLLGTVFDLPDAGYGTAKQLQILYDIQGRLSQAIDFFAADIPDIANVEFIYSKKIGDGKCWILDDDSTISDSMLRDRKKLIQWYKNQLNKYLTYQLKSLQTDVETYISQFKNLQENPDIKDWYPELADEEDPRIKYHSHNYWDTAIELYRKDTFGSKKAVWNHIDNKMEDLSLEHTKSLSTFKSKLPKKIKERMDNREQSS